MCRGQEIFHVCMYIACMHNKQPSAPLLEQPEHLMPVFMQYLCKYVQNSYIDLSLYLVIESFQLRVLALS